MSRNAKFVFNQADEILRQRNFTKCLQKAAKLNILKDFKISDTEMVINVAGKRRKIVKCFISSVLDSLTDM